MTALERADGFKTPAGHSATCEWKEIEAGNEWIVDADLKDFFGSAEHEKIVTLLSQRVSDGRVLRLTEAMLKAGSYGEGRLFPTQRCWQHAWVLDLDIRAYFDSLSHELLLRAVRKHTDCAWVLLYIERWLKAPVQLEDGTLRVHRPYHMIARPDPDSPEIRSQASSWLANLGRRTSRNLPPLSPAGDGLLG